jgi:hypothetical protein
MLRVTQRTIRPIRNCVNQQQCRSKSSSSPLEGDAGSVATHLHHKMTTFLSIATPIYFLSPDSMTDGLIDKAVGLLLAVNVSAHSWIGLNYVITDYIPKVSKTMVGPARAVTAGFGAITFLGLGKIAVNGKGGLKGAVLGLWKKKDEK